MSDRSVFTFWDRLARDECHRAGRLWPAPATLEEERVEPFEQAIGAPGTPQRGMALGEVVDEYRKRVGRYAAARPSRARWRVGLLLLAVPVWIGSWLAAPRRMAWTLSASSLLLGIYLIVYSLDAFEGPRRHAAICLRRRRCPDCGYDLAGCSPGVPLNDDGVDVGPRRCPECGLPWPLVPPPRPVLSSRAGAGPAEPGPPGA